MIIEIELRWCWGMPRWWQRPHVDITLPKGDVVGVGFQERLFESWGDNESGGWTLGPLSYMWGWE